MSGPKLAEPRYDRLEALWELRSMSLSPYDRDLDRNPANFQPLTPLTFLERSAAVFPSGTISICMGQFLR